MMEGDIRGNIEKDILLGKGRSEEIPDLAEYLVPEKDRKLIYDGLMMLGKYLSELDELPDIIIYADVSARPLAYAVNPILEKIYSDRGEKMPPRMFMATERRIHSLDRIAAMKEKAKDIIQKCNLDKDSKILIIDHVSEEADTIKNVRRAFADAFQAERDDLKIPAFVFFARSFLDTKINNIVSGVDPRRCPGLFKYWDYKNKVTGVEKNTNELYSKKIDERDVHIMRIVRKAMKEIGEQAAVDLS